MTVDLTWAIVGAVGGAIAGVAAVLAVIVAWVQLRQVAQSSRASVRPYAQVDFYLDKRPSIDPSSSGESIVYLDIVNTGRTPAYDLTLQVAPDLDLHLSLAADDYKAAVARRFDGEHPVAMLAAGARLRLFLGRFTEVMGAGLPTSYEVTATYADSFNDRYGPERFVLRLEDWAEGAAQEDSLARISKDLQGVRRDVQGVSKDLQGIRKSLPS